MKLDINGTLVSVPDDQRDDALLWVLRDTLGLVGTRYGCDSGVCGNCNVLVDDSATRACNMTAEQLGDRSVTTLEGLANASTLHPVQQAFLENPLQCCWCMSGHIIEAVSLLKANPAPSAEQVDDAMTKNYCRCGGYNNIRKNVLRAAEILAQGGV